jgi:hypothetical protein
MNIDRKWLATYAVLAFVLGSFLGGAMWNFAGIYVPEVPPVNLLKEGSLLKFESEQQLVTFLQTRPQTYYYGDFDVAVGRGFFSSFKGIMVAESLDAAPGTSPSNIAGNLDYSGTNIQVEGVDEADIVKTDGNYIYLASRDRVFIVKAFPPEGAKISSTIEFDFFVSNLYVNEDKLVVIQSQDLYYSWGPWDIVPPEEYLISTIVHIYDIADRAKPEIERTIRVDGFYTNSRMIGDYVYTITSQPSILK